MTQDKAREFFSAYHEGTLEPGLRLTLERRLATNLALNAEYEAFVETVGALDEMRLEAIVAPIYLNDRIASRLEGAREVSAARPFWADLFAPRVGAPRLAWAAGVAGLLLVSAFGLRGLGVGGAGTASLAPVGGGAVRWSLEENGITARFDAGTSRRIAVLPEGGDLKNYSVKAGQRFELSLSNPNAAARRFKISVGDALLATVALPGSRTVARKAGSGTVTEFASALADAYRVPVVVKGVAIGSTLRWTFDSTDARAAADAALSDHGSATLMDDNVLQIGQ